MSWREGGQVKGMLSRQSVCAQSGGLHFIIGINSSEWRLMEQLMDLGLERQTLREIFG